VYLLLLDLYCRH